MDHAQGDAPRFFFNKRLIWISEEIWILLRRTFFDDNFTNCKTTVDITKKKKLEKSYWDLFKLFQDSWNICKKDKTIVEKTLFKTERESVNQKETKINIK